MLAPTQRRRFPLILSLPVLVAVVLLVVARLVSLQRADIIAELADRVTHGEPSDATAAVRQLASIRRAPVSLLVSAATSADRVVAEEAKTSITRSLRRAQRQIDSGRRLRPVARELAELAEALNSQRTMFSRADYPWLSSTTRKVLELANEIPPRQTPLVAMHCDSILAMIASKSTSNRDIATNEPEIEEPLIDDEAMIDGGIEPHHAGVRAEPPIASTDSTMRKQADSSNAEIENRPATALRRPAMPLNAAREASATESVSVPWQSSWSHPVLRILPASPMNPPPPEEQAPLPSPPSSESPPPPPSDADPPMAEIDSRILLRDWLAAEDSQTFALESELTRRGFGRLSERLVARLFSANSADRLALVDAVLTEPGVDARPWLIILSEDSDADVRLLAVTIMATSNDPALVEKAWQVSIRDQDSRIAGLAGRLRERRNGSPQ